MSLVRSSEPSAPPDRAGSGRRPRLTWALALIVAGAWLAGGFIGTYSYLENYYLHRGFAMPTTLAHAAGGRLLTVHFYSPALRRRADYLAYLPPGYAPARRYPVFYLLHGTPDAPSDFITIAHIEIRLNNLISEGRVRPMILVFPDGRIDGNYFSDSEWANTGAGRYESYVVDVVRDVDRRFAALAERSARVIGGLSEGAYGAINIALHHPALFGSVEVWSGYFVQRRSGPFAHASSAQLAANSPLEYVHTLHALRLRVFMYVGRADRDAAGIRKMAGALKAAGARVVYRIYRGGHDWQLWIGHLGQMLVLAGHDVTRPSVGTPSSLRFSAVRPWLA